MDAGFRLNSCDEFDGDLSNYKLSNPEELGKRFQIIAELGVGIVKVSGANNEVFAVKLMGIRDNKLISNELKISCKMNRLSTKSLIFTRFYGWTVVERVPENWRIFLENSEWYSKRRYFREFFMLFMEVNDTRIDEHQFSFTQLKSILIMLLHGLMVARRQFSHFHHDDLYARNIMIKFRESHPSERKRRNDQFDDIHLDLFDGTFLILENVDVIPKIIDFEHASFNDEMICFSSDYSTIKEDFMNELINNLEDHEKTWFYDFFNSQKYEELIEYDAGEPEPILAFLRRYSGFKRSKPNTEKLEMCLLCNSMEAKYSFRSIPLVCGAECKEKYLATLKRFLP